jgi:hypothetical protein
MSGLYGTLQHTQTRRICRRNGSTTHTNHHCYKPKRYNGNNGGNKENRREVAEYTQKDYLVQQHIFGTVTDQMMLQISHQTTGAAMWKEIRTLHEGKSALIKADVRKCMLLARCDKGGDVKMHFRELNRLRQIMAGMGMIVDDEDYTAIVMGLLPDSY